MEFILEILATIGWVLLAITILVFVHEMGHFLTAKMFKMRVDKFSVGFPPKIFGTKIGETEYVIGATPLGGYVKIAGMVDESMDTNFMNAKPEPWEFRSKPVWQRVIVITAGVFFNIVLAAVIFISLKYAYGEIYIPAESVAQVFVAEGSIAHNIGLRTGDKVLAVGGEELDRYNDLEEGVLLADPLTITVIREGSEITFNGPDNIMTQLGKAGDLRLGLDIMPSVISSVVEGSAAEGIGLQPYDQLTSINGNEISFWAQVIQEIESSDGASISITWARPLSRADTTNPISNARYLGANDISALYEAEVAPIFSEADNKFMLGIGAPDLEIRRKYLNIQEEKVSLVRAVFLGLDETWSSTFAIVTSLKRIFSGREDLRENLGGPVMVAKVTKAAADAGMPYFWRIVAMLSITLAIMNILPIPALDGGHLIFLLYEGITRREPSLKVRMWLQQIGMVLLLVFMTFLVFNDILRL